MVNQDIIDNIRESADIVSIVEEYLPLKRTGSNYKACCPFHKEKTPSFVVSPAKQIYHCFGCGASGNVFNFIMEIEGLDFMDVLNRLADRTGVKLGYEKRKVHAKSIKNNIIELNSRSSKFYSNVLSSSNGKRARDYLKKRGVNAEMIKKFQLGYAPEGNKLIRLATREGVKEDILIKSGLAGRGNSGRLFDMFRDRIVFPIFNDQGKIMGFGGRVLDDSQGPKYLNTAQTEIFEKRKMMYGFFQGKEAIKNANTVLILEGYMDVIAAHQFGIENAVATLGTALTEDHIYKLKHWTDEVIFIFDSDEAGSNATARGLEIVLGSQLRAKVCELPGGCDPEDVIRKNSTDFKNYIEASIPILKWRIDYSRKKYENINDEMDRKVRIVGDLVSVISSLKDIEESVGHVKSSEIINFISEELDIPERVIVREINRISGKKRQYKSEESILNNRDSRLPKGKEEKFLRELLHIVVKYPKYIEDISGIVVDKSNKGNYYYDLLEKYIAVYVADIKKMIENVDESDKQVLTELTLSPLNSAMGPGEYIEELKRDYEKYKMEKRFKAISLEINTMIKNNKTVSKTIKEEYDKLKKVLKGSGRNNKARRLLCLI